MNVEQILAGMTLEEKLGQMFVTRRPQDDEVAMKCVTDYHIGGFTLYAVDFANRTPDEARALIASYQKASPIPMFIAVDCEGGTVVRASKYPAYRQTPYLSPRELLAEGGIDAAYADACEKSDFLRDLGVNFNYAPVCDMSGNPDCFIYKRTASHDPEETAAYIEAIVRGTNEHGMIGSLKHFPGYGGNADTHTGAAVDRRSLDALEQAQEVIKVHEQYGREKSQPLAESYGIYGRTEAYAIVRRASAPDHNDMDLRVMAIGPQVSFLFAPYEMFSEHGSYMRKNTAYDITFIASCTDGGEGYLPSLAAFEYGCYESYTTNFARGTGEELADTYLDMLSKMKEGHKESID